MALTLQKFHLISILVIFFVDQLIEARQIRINRYDTQIDEDDSRGGVVDVPLTKLQPAPTLGDVAANRSGRAFRRPNATSAENVTDSSYLDATTTTEYPLDWSTTTANYDLESTTISVVNEENVPAARAKVPYPAAGYRPSRAFLLPTEIEATTTTITENDSSVVSTTVTPVVVANKQLSTSARKAPYPAAGYRPSRAFLLPTEAQQQSEVEQPPAVSNHPICGSNANPLAPKPAADAENNPESENVYITAAVGPAVVSAQVPEIIIRSEPLVSQPIYIGSQPFAYSTQWQTW